MYTSKLLPHIAKHMTFIGNPNAHGAIAKHVTFTGNPNTHGAIATLLFLSDHRANKIQLQQVSGCAASPQADIHRVNWHCIARCVIWS